MRGAVSEMLEYTDVYSALSHFIHFYGIISVNYMNEIIITAIVVLVVFEQTVMFRG